MGDIAEMMLDGTLCAVCGVYLDGANVIDGIPNCCNECKSEPSPAPKRHECPVCEKPFGTKGAKKAHLRDKHKLRYDVGGKVVPVA